MASVSIKKIYWQIPQGRSLGYRNLKKMPKTVSKKININHLYPAGHKRGVLTPKIPIFESNKAVLGGYNGLNDLKFYIAHFLTIFNMVAKN